MISSSLVNSSSLTAYQPSGKSTGDCEKDKEGKEHKTKNDKQNILSLGPNITS
jgi:hypothetical protein